MTLKRHLINEYKDVAPTVDLQGRVQAVCHTAASIDLVEPLHDFLQTAAEGIPVCKNCFKKAKPQSEDATHQSHSAMEIIAELPDAIPEVIRYMSLTEIWNFANEQFVGLDDRAVADVPPIAFGSGICAVCGGRLDPGTAVQHESQGLPARCASTDSGAVHADCFDRPIPYAHRFEVIEVS